MFKTAFPNGIRPLRVSTVVLTSALCFSCASYSPSADSSLITSLDLPNSWELSEVKSSSCNQRSNGENSYAESSSKFLTWLTGDVELAEYEPVGEVANYFGFAAARGNIRERAGEQGDEGFRGSIYTEILELLDTDQRAVLYDLLEQQKPILDGFLDERINLINEIWAQKQDQSINFDRVTELMTLIGKYEGMLTITGAQAYTKLMPILRDDQLKHLADIRAGKVTASDMRNTDLPYATEARAQYRQLSDFEQEVMQTIASKLFSWGTSTLTDAIYLPPGKIANYFGFANYRYVDRAQVSRSGAARLVHDNLNNEQRSVMCHLSWAIIDFTNAYIEGRAELIREVWKLHEDPATDLDYNVLAEQYAMTAGIGEGRRGIVEAMAYNLIESTLSEDQIATFNSLRAQSTGESAKNADRSGNTKRQGNNGGNREGAINNRDRSDREARGNREGGRD